MVKQHCLCLYCGHDWEVLPYLSNKLQCEKCLETKAIKTKTKLGRQNVYGYPEDEKPKVRNEYFED